MDQTEAKWGKKRKGAATAPTVASARARAGFARFFMLCIIPFSPRFVLDFEEVVKDSATDLHPALSSPSATPLRSGGYAGKVKRADGTSASAKATKRNAPYGR